MAFSPPVLGCLAKKACKRGVHGHPRNPSGYALGSRCRGIPARLKTGEAK